MPLAANEAIKVNWDAPWLAHLLPTLPAGCMPSIAQAQDMKAALNSAVEHRRAQGQNMRTGQGAPLHFIAQEALPEGRAYEEHIALTGGVPTRLNLHDFFNACVWLTFPQTKAILNARQYAQIKRDGVQHERGMARDAITLFDENAAILVTANPQLSDALRAFDWCNALIAPRDLFEHPFVTNPKSQAAVYLFGHALMDKLTAPRKSICAHTWVVSVAPEWFEQDAAARMADIDQRLSATLRTHEFHTHDFCPLPILGVPHFWQDNADANFYNDAHVFRAGRLRELTK